MQCCDFGGRRLSPRAAVRHMIKAQAFRFPQERRLIVSPQMHVQRGIVGCWAWLPGKGLGLSSLLYWRITWRCVDRVEDQVLQ